MSTPSPIINTDIARSAYTFPHASVYEYNPFSNREFSNYSPAYVLSNENLRWITGLTADMARKVLTVTGSGDQALYYAINGAQTIDTFDISYCANVISNIKTAALKFMSREEYVALLIALHKTGNAANLAAIRRIMPQLPHADAKFLENMNGCKIFNNGMSPYDYTEYYPTQTEYQQMQNCVQTMTIPSRFIWTNVQTLHTHLAEEYDVINLSNIFQYLTEAEIMTTLKTLHHSVRVNGYIIAHEGSWGIYTKKDAYKAAAKEFKSWAEFKIAKENPKLANSEEVLILQRIR